jgi:hypothetical protein
MFQKKTPTLQKIKHLFLQMIKIITGLISVIGGSKGKLTGIS